MEEDDADVRAGGFLDLAADDRISAQTFGGWLFARSGRKRIRIFEISCQRSCRSLPITHAADANSGAAQKNAMFLDKQMKSPVFSDCLPVPAKSADGQYGVNGFLVERRHTYLTHRPARLTGKA